MEKCGQIERQRWETGKRSEKALQTKWNLFGFWVKKKKTKF